MELSQSPKAVVSLRPDLTAELMASTGLDEDSLDRLVRAFYFRVRSDEMLGPVFAAVIEDWEPHLERMVRFWSSVALMTGRYHGQPMQKHMGLAIGPEHFRRWLDLFRDTAHRLLTPAGAAHVVAKAEQIGAAMQARRALA
jgi:hemoglobin